MSIDFLLDLERMIDNGKTFFATQGLGRNQWIVGKSVAELETMAQRAANQKKIPVSIVRVISPHDTVAGDLFLVPTEIGDPGTRGEPNVKWATVDTKEAAEMMRDVRRGPSPIFGMQLEKTLDPKAD
jgi:hypothetical protein